jgi:hypothetical protein
VNELGINSCLANSFLVRSVKSHASSPYTHFSSAFPSGDVIHSKQIRHDISVVKLFGKQNKVYHVCKTFNAPFDTRKLQTLFSNIFDSMKLLSPAGLVYPVG